MHKVQGVIIVSTIDMNNNHSVTSYTSGSTKPLTGQRLAVVYWKTGKDGVKKESKSVSIPVIELNSITASERTLLEPYLVEMLQTVQGKIIRERIESGASTILGAEISVASCIQYLESNVSDTESGSSVRLTKESLATWFDLALADKLMLVLADKLGVSSDPTAEEVVKIDSILAEFKGKIGSLASGAVKLDKKLAISIKNAVSLAGEDDVIAVKLASKLDKMIAVEKVELFDIL